ncbi:MAG: hypothetical protein PVJ57_10240 [Phycisphaerae bacterium]|jgi:hypothetical protein
MGRRRRLLTAAGVLAALCGAGTPPPAAFAQTSQPATSTAPTTELPPAVATLLDSVQDYTYDFNNPAYYAILEFVKRSPRSPGFAIEPIVIDDWQQLVERPADFRGKAVTIEGTLGRNKDSYVHGARPDLGTVWQLELRRPDEPVACTVICTNDVSDLPLEADVRFTGYFVQMRRYPTRSGRPGLAALIVAPGPTEVSRSAPITSSANNVDWRWLVAAVVAGLIITVLLLRRAARVGRTDISALRARRPAPLNLSDDLADWAADRPPDDAPPP